MSRQRGDRTLHIISWNVASWATTIERIKSKHGSLDNWLNKHDVDVLCIQEVKVSSSELTNRSREFGATGEHGYDTFWACPSTNPHSKSTKSQGNGLNGVATFAKRGLTQSSSSCSLGDSLLDGEGRCLFTDHGSFVIFNVYVPNSGSEHKRFCYKMRFLRALNAAISHQKRLGKHVIALGDFNIAPRPVDVCRPNRKLQVNRIDYDQMEIEPINGHDFAAERSLHSNRIAIVNTIGRSLNCEEYKILTKAVDFIKCHWPSVANSLRQTLAIELEGSTGRFKATATRESDGKKVKLGRSQPYIHSTAYCLMRRTVRDDDTGEEFEIIAEEEMYVEEFRDAITALAPHGTPGLTAQQWDLLADVFGKTAHVRSSVEWFRALLRCDGMGEGGPHDAAGGGEQSSSGAEGFGSTSSEPTASREDDCPGGIAMKSFSLVDSFPAAHPHALNRFTCWDQSTNRRYSNGGSRIDHILVDREWWEHSCRQLPDGCGCLDGYPAPATPLSTQIEAESSSVAFDDDDNRDAGDAAAAAAATATATASGARGASGATSGAIVIASGGVDDGLDGGAGDSADYVGASTTATATTAGPPDGARAVVTAETAATTVVGARVSATDLAGQRPARANQGEASQSNRSSIHGNEINSCMNRLVCLCPRAHPCPLAGPSRPPATVGDRHSDIDIATQKSSAAHSTNSNTDDTDDSTDSTHKTQSCSTTSINMPPEVWEHAAAIRACTAGGRFLPAPVGGGGIPDAPPGAYEAQFRPAHTGIIYMPPEYSDHVAVSVLLSWPPDASEPSLSRQQQPLSGPHLPLALSKDAATRATQPHLRQAAITSHFKRGAQAPQAPQQASQTSQAPQAPQETIASLTSSTTSIGAAVCMFKPSGSAAVASVISASLASATSSTRGTSAKSSAVGAAAPGIIASKSSTTVFQSKLGKRKQETEQTSQGPPKDMRLFLCSQNKASVHSPSMPSMTVVEEPTELEGGCFTVAESVSASSLGRANSSVEIVADVRTKDQILRDASIREGVAMDSNHLKEAEPAAGCLQLPEGNFESSPEGSGIKSAKTDAEMRSTTATGGSTGCMRAVSRVATATAIAKPAHAKSAAASGCALPVIKKAVKIATPAPKLVNNNAGSISSYFHLAKPNNKS